MPSVSRVTAAASLELSQKETAQALVDRVLDSVRQMNVKAGVIQEFATLDEWRHRTTLDVEPDLAYLEIHRTAIVAALSDYLADNSLRTREIDWLFLNLLTYAEYIATVAEIRKKLVGIDAYIKGLHPPKTDHASSIATLTSRPWQPVVALVAVTLAFFVHPALAAGIGAALVYGYWRRRKSIERIDAVLSSMLRTYLSFNSLDLSWSHVCRVLEESRREGAVWDASLFKLAEVRQSAA